MKKFKVKASYVMYVDTIIEAHDLDEAKDIACLLYTSPSPRDRQKSRMPSSA